jgi:hypothetical protein
MSIDHRLTQAAKAAQHGVQDVDVVARLHELPRRQRVRRVRAAIAALAIFASMLIPTLTPLGRDTTTSVPAVSQPTLPPATGVTVQVLNGVFVTGLAHALAAQVRTTGYDVVAAKTALGSYSVSRVYYTAGHRADAEAFRVRFPAFRVVEPAPANLDRRIALHAVIGRDYPGVMEGGCSLQPIPIGC